MVDIALFHSVLGLKPGIEDAASRLGAAGHSVTTVDQYGGRVFDEYGEAEAYRESVGWPTLMQRALDGVANLPDGFVVLGFSNGGGMAEYVATHRLVSGAILCSGTLPLEMLGVDAWPAGVPVQIHSMVDDPFRRQAWTDAVVGAIEEAGAEAQMFEYQGAGHLFTDSTRPTEYDAEAAELLCERVLAFCAQPSAAI